MNILFKKGYLVESWSGKIIEGHFRLFFNFIDIGKEEVYLFIDKDFKVRKISKYSNDEVFEKYKEAVIKSKSNITERKKYYTDQIKDYKEKLEELNNL